VTGRDGARRAGTAVLHVRCPDRVEPEVYRGVLELMSGLSAMVQPLPPTAALADVAGARRYLGTDAPGIAGILRLRVAAHLGISVRIGVGPSITVASTASAQVPARGGVLAVPPGQVAAWLRTLPVDALHGIGPAQTRTLHQYGVRTVAQLAGLPLATVQRVLGGTPGRTAWERARGTDPLPVTPGVLPATASLRHAFAWDHHDGTGVRAALLGLAVRLGLLLRERGQAARALTLTLTLTFAGGDRWERTRRLPEPSAHEDDLRLLAYQLLDEAGLQRARLRGLVLRAENLADGDTVAEQISLDPAREARLAAEDAVDRVRAKFGNTSIGPASVFPQAS